MPQNQRFNFDELKTGDEKLDRHVKELLEFDRETLQSGARKIVDENISALDEVAKLIPLHIIAAAKFVQTNKDDIKSGANDETVRIIDYAIDFINETMGELLQKVGGEPESTESGTLLDGLNVIDQISHHATWFMGEKEIRPAIRFGLSNARQSKLLLDTTADWEDLLFLIQGLAKALRKDMSHAASMMEAHNIDIDIAKIFKGKFENHLENAVRELDQIIDLAPKLGAGIEIEDQ